DRFLATLFAQVAIGQPRALSPVHRSPSLQVRQGEVRLAVAAVGRAEQGEQCGVLRQRHQLTVTPCPAAWCEVEGEYPDFGDKWISHGRAPGNRQWNAARLALRRGARVRPSFMSATGRCRTAR